MRSLPRQCAGNTEWWAARDPYPGQNWVSNHNDYAQGHLAACVYCHGADYRGTPLSVAKIARTFDAGDLGTKHFAAGHQFNCYNCHNGPNGGKFFRFLQ